MNVLGCKIKGINMIDMEKMKLRYITDKKGRKREVILSIRDFRAIIEDLEDLAIAAERRDEEEIDHTELLKKIKARWPHAGLEGKIGL